MPADVFLDTSGWLALLNATDALHSRANDAWLQVGKRGGRIVLTDWIIAETGNGLARVKRTSRFAEALERVVKSPRVDLIFVDLALMNRAIELYAQHTDKSWGLVDCASFVVMSDRGMTDALTCDRHYEQAGFRCLLDAQNA